MEAATTPAAPAPPDVNPLQQKIFGADESDLSELSDSEDEQAPSPESDEEEEPKEVGDGDYVADTAAATERPVKGKKKRRSDSGDGEPRKKRRTKLADRSPTPEIELTPEERRKKELNDRLDAIIKKPKTKKKKRAGDEEDLGQAADEEEILRLRSNMAQATHEDIQAYQDGQPALAKLRLLKQVTTTLQKSHLEGVALDNGILTQIKEWLEPAPDKSLPALNIQRDLFSILLGMKNINTDALKDSHIGAIVLFYSRCPRVDQAISRTADQLVTRWMRPILRRSNTWRDKTIHQERRFDRDHERAGSSQPTRLRLASLLPGRQESGDGRRHAAIPRAFVPSYKVAPANRLDAPVVATAGRETMERFKAFNKQLKASRAADKRV